MPWDWREGAFNFWLVFLHWPKQLYKSWNEMNTFSSFYCQRNTDHLTPTTLGRFHFSLEISDLTTTCACVFWVPYHNHLHTKNKIELLENNINRIFVGHLYISLILQGSRMTETSNLLGCEMCLVDMWNVPFSMSLFYPHAGKFLEQLRDKRHVGFFCS